jgi:hypothetical protein
LDDIELEKSDILWMMQQVSVLIKLQECLVVLILVDNEYEKKLRKEKQMLMYNSRESSFPRKTLNLVFRE